MFRITLRTESERGFSRSLGRSLALAAVDISSAPLTVAAGARVTVTGVTLTFPSSAVPTSLQPNVVNNGSNLIGSLNSGASVGVRCSGLSNGQNGDQIGVTNPGMASAPANNGGPTGTRSWRTDRSRRRPAR